MRRPLSPRMHGVLEYLAVLVWALAPSRLGLGGVPEMAAYLVAGGIIVVSAFTNYPLGLVRVIPFRLHGWIDVAFTPLVLVAPWLLGFADQSGARNLFVAMGTFAVLVTLLTDFGEGEPAE